MLAVAGTLVGLAALSSGALRETVIAATAEPVFHKRAVDCVQTALERDGSQRTRAAVEADFDTLVATYPRCAPIPFDSRYVIAYGLLFSGILAIAFAPCHLAMRAAGDSLRDASFPLPAPRDPTFFDVVGHPTAFDALLETNLSATATFKAGVAIVTPLAASLLSTVLPA
jgi:hypothetical protein